MHNKADIAFLRAQNKKKPVENPPKLISAYMNGRRRMPDGSPFAGRYSIHRTPYAIEPLDNMSPFSGIKNTAILKPVQSGITTNCGENVIAYYIGARPAKIMYMSGTDGLLKKFANGRFDPLIDSCGFRPLIRSQSLKKNNRKSGDIGQYKEFPGGTLTLGSLQSEASMRQESVMIMIRDEIGLVDIQMSSGEGNRLKVSDGRTVAYDESGRVKILDYSTPGLHGYCLIEMQYLKGDQRKFRVKCPLCGKRQHLVMGDDRSNYGLKGDYTAGKLTNAHYLCYHCHDAIFNYQKPKMLATGIWEPTAEPIAKDFRSYHFGAFYSPMMSWLTIRREYDEAIDAGDDGMRSFTNLYLAEPFEPTGEQPELKTVIEIRSKYKSTEVPKGILYLTAFADVQRGKEKFKKYTQEEIDTYVKKHKNDHVRLQELPRIELEVMGHGAAFRTASIEWVTFYGHIDSYTTGAFKKFQDWIELAKVYKRKDGFEFPVQNIGVDSGDGKYIDTVYNFCSPLIGVYPTKGAKTPKKDKLKLTDVDEMVSGNIYNIKLSKTSSGQSLILINTNYYKAQIYNNFKNISQGADIQAPNSHITPTDYPDYYFSQLRAEKQKTDGTFHNTAGKRNEATDTLVGNKALSDFIINGMIAYDKEKLKKANPRLAQKTVQADEELRKYANRETVTKRITEDLIKIGWAGSDQ